MTRGSTSATSRVWIQGDLHAENYGTYMDSAGVLVFDVNDFDEAYLGHYTWDLQRMAASLALLGFRKALSDASIARLIETYARAYVETVRLFATSEVDRDFRLTLDNTEGPLRAVLEDGAAADAPERAGDDDDARRRRPRLAVVPGVRELEQDEQDAVLGRLRGVPGHDPRGQAPAVDLLRGQGHRRAVRVRDRLGRAARVQPAGRGAHAGAGERRRAVDEAGADARGLADRARRADPLRTSSTRATAPRSPRARCRRTRTRGWAGARSTASAR